ncbi:hypothetical protein [Halovenus salina]|uniref:DUF5658 domain-containing protein n=1 Tax=Halovenus salina TaxID=1510225 RepID=A0ABD5W738_9EURY|nr:hypothetical protein [Halovenus salina]
MGGSRALPLSGEGALGDDRIKRFWGLGLIAVFLHGVADPVITYITVSVYDVGREANPWLATHLEKGATSFLLVHAQLYLIIFGIFAAFTWLFYRGTDSEREQIYKLSLVLWSLIILWGAFIVGNNLFVLADGIGF